MKICPFISHMLGDENNNTLSLGERANASEDVVILGYNDEESRSIETDAANDSAQEGSALECLKESCRFYQTPSEQCRFDLIFSKIDGFESGTAEASPQLARDIDKIWKFQTQGVTEIVESLADSDKKQAENLDALKNELTERLQKVDHAADSSAIESIRQEIESLKDKLKERENGLDSLSTNVSDLADNVTQLKELSNEVSKKVAEFDESIPKESTIMEILEKSAEKTARDIKDLDFSEPVKSMEAKIEDILGKQKDSNDDLGKKLDAATEAQKGVEELLGSWKEEIVDRVVDLASRQEDWDKRINELVDHQKELAGYLEEGKKHREVEQTRSTKKESKKHNNLGVTSFHNGAYEMARDQFLQAVKLDPDFAEAYNNLGLAYTELDNEDKATEAFTKAVELNSSLHAAFNNLGYIFYKKGDYEQAVEMYNEALGKNNKNGPAYTNLGNAYYRMDRLDEAREAWTKALELDPGNEKAKRNLQRIGDGAK